MKYLLALALIGAVSGLSVKDLPEAPENGDLWVVLVAGSNGWFNYRHQADVCHAYQIVSSHGVPDERIIVMMYDDIANNQQNPTPGKMINEPNGTDVYHGVPKDFTGKNVNGELFLQILQGENPSNVGSGKKLKSGPNDNVFVYYTDHGAKGLVAFGFDILKATDLNKAIMNMHKKKMYNKMVMYFEACESGSMFQGLLPKDINVFATTASNSTTSSYACYFSDTYKTFLADVYSIKWMQDSDRENLQTETLEHQYMVTKKETNTSTVCEFGDMSISKMPVGDFQGMKKASNGPFPPSYYGCGTKDSVPGPEVPVVSLQKVIENPNTSDDERQDALDQLREIVENRQAMMEKMMNIAESAAGANNDGDGSSLFEDNRTLTQFECYYDLVDLFHARCFNLGRNDYALRMLNVFVNMCEKGYDTSAAKTAMMTECTTPQISGVY